MGSFESTARGGFDGFNSKSPYRVDSALRSNQATSKDGFFHHVPHNAPHKRLKKNGKHSETNESKEGSKSRDLKKTRKMTSQKKLKNNVFSPISLNEKKLKKLQFLSTTKFKPEKVGPAQRAANKKS